jgi:hypothetical protein
MGHGSSQIFTDKIAKVRLTAQGALQLIPPEKFSPFFLAAGDGVLWFLNLCAPVKICLPNFVFVSNFLVRFLNFRQLLTGSV